MYLSKNRNIIIVYELLEIDKNTWIYTTVRKLSVLEQI